MQTLQSVADQSKPKRKAISKKTRFEVFKRDAFTCQYCGAHPPGVLIHIDHVKPVADGGTNAIDNLVSACEPCNLGKGARLLSVVPQTLADKAKAIAEREEQLKGYQDIMEAKRERVEEETWRVLRSIFGKSCDKVRRDEHTSVKRFIEKLGVHTVLEASEIACGRVPAYKVFRYFCGVCWNLVRSQDAANA